MDPALQKRIQRYGWDKASDRYQELWQDQLSIVHDELTSIAKICPGEKILDVACGSGIISFRALKLTGEKGFVLGTDISEKMIGIADKKAQDMHFSNVHFERMDAEELLLEPNQFDAALCSLGLMYVPDPKNALKQIFRTLKPGGRCIVAVWGRQSVCGWSSIFGIVDQRVSSEVCPMFFNLGNESVLDKNFEFAGFSNIKIKKIRVILNYQTAEEACDASFIGGPVALAYLKFPENVKSEVCQEYLTSIESFRKGNGYEVPAEFVIGVGSKP